MIFIHIESILNVNEFNYNLPNYCVRINNGYLQDLHFSTDCLLNNPQPIPCILQFGMFLYMWHSLHPFHKL